MLEKGTVISKRYQIIEKLGSGGMAVAYKARDLRLGRFVTVKVLKEEYSENADFLTKFSSEASAAASLSHYNIVSVYDVGEDKGINYIVMEYVHGQSLKQYIDEEAPFDTITTLDTALQIASALSHAHKHHVVHRDIKPQNILVAVDGTIKVTDFGIARAATTNTYAADVNAMGSVHYFSPEQARGGFVNEKSDIYSLGITMFEMATGRVPFDASSSIAVALKHLNEELPDIKQYNPNVTRGLEGIIRKATQKKADERYDNIDLLISDLKLAIIEATRVSKKSNSSKNEPEKAKTDRKKAAAVATGAFSAGVAAETLAGDETTMIQPVKNNDIKADAEYKKAERILDDEDDENAEISDEETENTLYEEKIETASDESEIEKASDEDDGNYFDDFKEADYDDDDDDDEEDDEDLDDEELKVEFAREIKLPKSSVGFGKYSKKLKLNDENDDYDDDDDDDDDYDDDEFEDYYKEYDEEKRQEKKVTIAAVITALVIIAVIVFVGIKYFNVFDNAAAVFNKDRYVPNFIGMTYTEAEPEADKLGIKLVQGGVVESIEPLDTILSQSAEEGTAITDDMELVVTVSSGEEAFEMPNVIDSEESKAVNTISHSGLDANIVIQYEEAEGKKEGSVIKQSPEAGEKVMEGVDVVLTICKASDNLNTKVPNVEGLSVEEAKAKMEAEGLSVGNVSYTTSTTVAKGLVIKQTATPGEEILKNSSVDIVVSSGRPAPKPTQPENNTPSTPSTPSAGSTNSNSGSSSESSSGNNTNNDTNSGFESSDDIPVIGSME